MYSCQFSPPSPLLYTVLGDLRGATCWIPCSGNQLLFCTALSSEVQPTPQTVWGLKTYSWGLCCLYFSHSEQLYHMAELTSYTSALDVTNNRTPLKGKMCTKQRVEYFFLKRERTDLKTPFVKTYFRDHFQAVKAIFWLINTGTCTSVF